MRNKGRTYDFFEAYIKAHPSSSIVEMDTVYNDVSNGLFIQTFMLVSYGIMIAVYHTSITETSMVSGLQYIKTLLGDELFKAICQIIITDRGSEFSDAEGFERLVGNIFYCDFCGI